MITIGNTVLRSVVTLHTAITNVIIVLEWQSPCIITISELTETLAFRYCYHVSDRSVQCVIVTKNSETTAYMNTYYEIKQQMDSIPVVVTGNQLRHRLNVLYSFTPVLPVSQTGYQVCINRDALYSA